MYCNNTQKPQWTLNNALNGSQQEHTMTTMNYEQWSQWQWTMIITVTMNNDNNALQCVTCIRYAMKILL